jgi:alanyl-tRNA synthetase
MSSADKANVLVLLDKDIVSDERDAAKLIRATSSHIKGGGGGQPFLATAGGKQPQGVQAMLEAIEQIVRS